MHIRITSDSCHGRDDEFGAGEDRRARRLRIEHAAHPHQDAVSESGRCVTDHFERAGRGHGDFHGCDAAGGQRFRGIHQFGGRIGADDRDNARIEKAPDDFSFSHKTGYIITRKRDSNDLAGSAPSYFILHTSSFILHPSSFILHPSSFILHPFLPSRSRSSARS